MATTILSDEIIRPTELRANQKHWLDKATENIITIINGSKQLTLINRERISKLFAQKQYTDLVISYCYEFNNNIRSSTFPWTEYLNSEEKAEFYNELLKNIMHAIITDDWTLVEHLIEDWKATAQAINNPTLAKALLAKEDSSEYVEIKE